MQNTNVQTVILKGMLSYPFDLTDIYGIAPSLEQQLERNFAMAYIGRMDLNYMNSINIKKRNWYHERLIKQKRDEKEAIEKTREKNKG